VRRTKDAAVRGVAQNPRLSFVKRHECPKFCILQGGKRRQHRDLRQMTQSHKGVTNFARTAFLVFHPVHIDDLGAEFLRELEEFFVNYHRLSGKEYKILGARGPNKARKSLQQGMKKKAA